MEKNRLPRTKKFLSGVWDIIEAAADAKAEQDAKNAEIEEAIDLLMSEYTGDKITIIKKDD